MKNGFFQVGCTRGGTVIKLVKPVDGGTPVAAKEIADYLTRHGIGYDAGAITRGIQDAAAADGNEFLFLVNKELVSEIPESYIIMVNPEKMILSVRFYPPSMKGQRMSQSEFLRDLSNKGIIYGIDQDRVGDFFRAPCYGTDIVVAEGKEPRHGTDARIEYYFDTDPHAKPTLGEDGSVDFFHLNTINHCKKGDVLARLFPEDKGEDGFNVYGERIKPREVKRTSLKFGRNITLSEDKCVITSNVDGHVMLTDDKVFVSNLLEVENVDTSTGNIDYDGSVQVNGNVCANFKVHARGNVEVRGVVEGAEVEADGDIIIARGMNGMSKGKLVAGGNIVSKFIENATVNAQGYVSTESILHSTVMAGTEINVTGKRGFITGGRVCATNLIHVKTLGSQMGADTIVEVGVAPSVKVRLQELQKLVTEHKKSIEATHPALSATLQKIQQGVKIKPEQLKLFQEMLQEENTKKQEMEESLKEIERLQMILDESAAAKVEVTGEVFSGTKICIADVSMIVKSPMTYCKFIKSQGDVKMVAL